MFSDQLKWTLIVDKIVRENNIEVTVDDIRGFAKYQLIGYMGGNMPIEDQPWITDYVNKMVQDKKFVEETVHRIQTDKVFAWSEQQVKALELPITATEFTSLQQAHQHEHA